MAENRVFKVELDDKEVEFRMNKAGLEDHQAAQDEYNKTFSRAIGTETLLREELDDVVRRRGLWNDEKEAEAKALKMEIVQKLNQLSRGNMLLSNGKKIALEIAKLRNEVTQLYSARNSLDANTAQGQADNMSVNCLISRLTVYNDTGKPYFTGLDDYLNKAGEGDDVTIAAIMKFASLRYNVDDNADKQLPENQFLIKYGFVDKNLNFIDNKGRLVDEDGRLINEDGKFINEDNELVDVNGNRVDEDGNPLDEIKPFLDESGNPVVLDEPEPPKKRGRPKKQVESDSSE